jgi:hypothetical protein
MPRDRRAPSVFSKEIRGVHNREFLGHRSRDKLIEADPLILAIFSAAALTDRGKPKG